MTRTNKTLSHSAGRTSGCDSDGMEDRMESFTVGVISLAGGSGGIDMAVEPGWQAEPEAERYNRFAPKYRD